MEEDQLADPTIGGGSGRGKAPPSEREEEQALSAALLRASRENAVTMNENRPGLPGRPTRAGKRGSRLRRKLSRPAQRAETGELTTSAGDEREARENHQWRRTASAVRRLEGVWGSEAPPREREEEQALSAAPLGARRENAAMMNEEEVTACCHRPRATRDDQRGRAGPPGPPAQWAGEDPVSPLDERWRNAGARTTSGGSPACWADDWMGS